MARALQSILLAVDQYRSDVRSSAVLVGFAKKLGIPARVAYVVDHEDLRIPSIHGPTGWGGRVLMRGSRREECLREEGEATVKDIRGLLAQAGIPHDSTVSVGSPTLLWAEQGVSYDLTAVVPVKEDFSTFDRCIGAKFVPIACRSARPVLVLREGVSSPETVDIFCTDEAQVYHVLSVAGELAPLLEGKTRVFLPKNMAKGPESGVKALGRFELALGVSTPEPKNFQEVLRNEAREPGSELGSVSLLVLDGGFSTPLWLSKNRRLLETLIRTSPHSLLVFPKLTAGRAPLRVRALRDRLSPEKAELGQP